MLPLSARALLHPAAAGSAGRQKLRVTQATNASCSSAAGLEADIRSVLDYIVSTFPKCAYHVRAVAVQHAQWSLRCAGAHLAVRFNGPPQAPGR